MSTDQHLYRLTRPIQEIGDADPTIVPFGTLEEVMRRLEAAKGIKRLSRRRQGAKAPGRWLQLRRDGQRIDLLVSGDPPDCIMAFGAAPADLLPVVRALRDLGPLAIYDPQGCAWIDPADLASDDPRPAPALHDPAIRLTPDDWVLRMHWAAREHPGLVDLEWVARDGRLYIIAQDEEGGLRAYLTAIDAKTGQTVWCIRCGSGIPQLVSLGDFLITINPPNVFGIDPATGIMRWRLKLGLRSRAHPGAVVDADNGTIAVASSWGPSTYEELVFTADGRGVSRQDKPHPERSFGEHRPEDLLAPGRDRARCVVLDERVALEFKGAKSLVPYPRDPSGNMRSDDAAWRAWEAAIAPWRDKMKITLFDRKTGETISERVFSTPERWAPEFLPRLPQFLRSEPQRPAARVVGQ